MLLIGDAHRDDRVGVGDEVEVGHVGHDMLGRAAVDDAQAAVGGGDETVNDGLARPGDAPRAASCKGRYGRMRSRSRRLSKPSRAGSPLGLVAGTWPSGEPALLGFDISPVPALVLGLVGTQPY